MSECNSESGIAHADQHLETTVIDAAAISSEATMTLLQSIVGFKQTFIEQRRSPRENVQFPAWIDIGNGAELRDCTVLDVADNGARIRVAYPAELPREFYLVLSKNGTRRRARLAWRSGEEVGMSYVGPLELGRL
jgi:hypothetical protein